MPGEMDFDSLGQKPLATLLAPPTEDGPTAFCFHASTEAKLLFTRALAGLIGAFHGKI